MANYTSNSTADSPTLHSTKSTTLPPTAVVSVVILTLTMMLSILGNSLVCLACVFSRNLQNYTSVFIVSLAISDLLIAVISVPVWISIQLNGQPSMVAMPSLYMLWLCLDILCGTASIMNLVFISVDRLLAVCHPLRYQVFMSRGKVTMAIIFLWSYALVISGLYLSRWQGYAVFVSTAAFFAPLIVMLVAYSVIFKVAIAHARTIRAQTQSTRRDTGIPRVNNFRQDLKAARTLSIVIGTFIICWCPFFILNLVSYYCKKSCPILFPVVVAVKLLHYGNSAMNPIIYGCLNKSFRSAFKAILQRGFHWLICRNNAVEYLDGSTATGSSRESRVFSVSNKQHNIVPK